MFEYLPSMTFTALSELSMIQSKEAFQPVELFPLQKSEASIRVKT